MARKKKFAPNDNNLAIAYYRFSSHSQNEASIDQQRELAHEWADAHGFKIVQEYEDAAISGTTDARPGFQQMLSEVAKIRPHTLIMWKTDRLGRDKYVLAMAKKKIRDAGCEIHLLAEHIPTEGPEGVLIEGLMEAMAEYYSRQLSQNIQRGMDYNAQHALYNGHKLFGYDVDRSTKKYIPDPNTAPFVQWAFREYALGRPLKAIAEEMNAQGLRTPRNAKFSVNMLNKMLKNRAYIGEYHHGDITVAGGMPVLVDEATFDRAQRRFAENKRKGSQRAHGMDGAEAPRYWLTGKLYCGECGSTMQGVSGTSKTGRTYYYYYCSAQRRKECHLHKARKRDLEDMVLFALHNIVDDEENVTALALDAAEYYEKNHNGTAYLEALEAKRREVEKSLANLVKVIERGVVSDTVTQRLTQLEEQKSALNDAIGTENVRVSLCEDRHSIQAYFDKFLHADVNDPEIRDQVFEYFVDKVYLYDDKLVVSMWFSEDDKQEITWRDWFSLDEYWTDESPFAKGEAVEFDCSRRHVLEQTRCFTLINERNRDIITGNTTRNGSEVDMRNVCEKEKTPCRDGMVSLASAAEVGVPPFFAPALALGDLLALKGIVLAQGPLNLRQVVEGVGERCADQRDDDESDERGAEGNGVALKGTAGSDEQEHADTDDGSRDGLQRMYDAIGLFACHELFSFFSPSIGNDFPNLPAAPGRLFRAYRPDRVVIRGYRGMFSRKRSYV